MRVARLSLLVGSLLALTYSMFNLGEWFGEFSSNPQLGFALAVAVDVGILACAHSAYSIRSKLPLRAVAILAAVSWLGNAQHALMVRIGHVGLLADWKAQDIVTLANVWFVAGIAPLLALLLAHVYEQTGESQDENEAHGENENGVQPPRENAPPKRVRKRKSRGGTYETIREFAKANPDIETKKELAETLGVAPSSVTRAGVERNGSGWRIEA